MQNAPSPERTTRRRGRVLDEAILDAAWSELAERGWAGFTVEGVATRSGAAKPVIYRRWKGRVELAHEILDRAARSGSDPVRSSGDLRTDLLAFLTGMASFLRSPFGEAARGVVHDGDPRYSSSLFEGPAVVAAVQGLVDQAVARGELDRGPSTLAVNLGHAVVMSEFLHTHQPPSEAAITELVETVWLPALRFSAG